MAEYIEGEYSDVYCDIMVRLLQHRLEEQKLRAEFNGN